jgi:lysophospholipase L1-like esterase
MAKRKESCPTAIEALEGRIVLSGFLDFLKADPIVGLIQDATNSDDAKAGSGVAIGVLGDSYSDEYRFDAPDRSQARNWVEILSGTGRASFGPYSTRSRGVPRGQGFAAVWAQDGATTSDMVANQLPGLAAQVAKGQVKYASIFVGGNDFLDLLQGVQQQLQASQGVLSPEQMAAFQAQLAQTTATAEANVGTAVAALLAASPKVKLVVTTVPTVAETPIVRQAEAANPSVQPLVDAASQAIAQYDQALRDLAAGHPSRVALNDLAAESAALSQAPGGSVPFGGTTIDLTTPGPDYHHFFVDDIHVGTVGQGLVANSIVQALNTSFHARIRPLTARQIVQFAAHVSPRTP